MWTLIIDCAKQLKLHAKVREKIENNAIVYEIIEVETDQYKLALISRHNIPEEGSQHNILNCKQLVQYNFEVLEEEEL
ncbi:MAG: hypothetical protein H7X88_12115 [Gloeobacteraceae cyanobacterium ES-bin-316]|nr:hypothetical protein [Ferruginibacter sp.]